MTTLEVAIAEGDVETDTVCDMNRLTFLIERLIPSALIIHPDVNFNQHSPHTVV